MEHVSLDTVMMQSSYRVY